MDTENNNQDQQLEQANSPVAPVGDTPTMSGVRDAAPKSHLSFYAAVAIILIVLVGAAWWLFIHTKDTSTNEAVGLEDNFPEVVAIVNGVEIARDDFMEILGQTEQLAAAQGASIDDQATREAIKSQALDVLVNTQLLLQAANSAGVVISDDRVDEQMVALEQQYGDKAGLEAEMTKVGLSEDELRSNIRNQFITESFITGSEEYVGVAVSDKEVEELYNSLVEQGQDLPPLTDIAEQIKQSILTQKQQQAIGQLIERLRSGASIETMI